MVNGSNELIFKFIIDGKEVPVTLDLVKGEFVETGEVADKTKEQMEAALTALKQKLNETTSEAQKVHSTLSQIGEDNNFGKNLGAEFDGVNVTVRDLLERLADLKKNFQGAAIGGEEFGRWTRELNAIQEQLDAVTNKTRITTLANEGLTNEVMKYSAVNQQSVNGISEYITSQNLSIDAIEKTISALDIEIKSLGVNSEAWKQKTAAAANLKAAYGQVIAQNAQLGNAQNTAAAGMNKMNLAMGQFGYLVGDADMFLVNFRMGLMSIGNNIPMVVQYLQYAKQEASSLNMTLGQAFMQSIAGPGGLLLGVNAAVFAMQILSTAFQSSTKEIKTQQDELKKLAEEYKKFTEARAQHEIEMRQIELGTLDKMPGQTTYSYMGKELTIEDEKKYGKDFEKAKQLKSEIELLQRVAFLSNEQSDAEKRLSENRKKLLEINKQNFEALIPMSSLSKNIMDKWGQSELRFTNLRERNFRRAKEQLELWIKADQDFINSQKNSEAAEKRFNELQTKSFADMFKDEMTQQAKAELAGKDYVELLEFQEEAQNKYNDHLGTFHNVKNKTELEAWNLIRDLMQAQLKEIQDELKKREDSNDKEIEDERKKIDAKVKLREADWKDEEDKKKFQRELPSKIESDPYERQKKQLNAEEALTVERAALYGATEEEITNIHAYYSRQREQIDFQANQVRLSQTSQMLGQLAGMFNKQTAAYKILASAQVMIEAYKGVMAAYAPPPVGVGPVLAPLMTGIIITTGLLNVANIMKQDTAMKGYETGGRLPRGKYGFFEGTHNEIVAPEEDFMTVAHELIGRSIIEARNYLSVSNGALGDSSLINRLEAKFDQLEKTLADRISIAVFDNETAEEIGRHVDATNRKNR